MKCYPFTVLRNFLHDFIRKLISCFTDLVSRMAFVFVFLEEDKNCSLANFVLFLCWAFVVFYFWPITFFLAPFCFCRLVLVSKSRICLKIWRMEPNSCCFWKFYVERGLWVSDISKVLLPFLVLIPVFNAWSNKELYMQYYPQKG